MYPTQGRAASADIVYACWSQKFTTGKQNIATFTSYYRIHLVPIFATFCSITFYRQVCFLFHFLKQCLTEIFFKLMQHTGGYYFHTRYLSICLQCKLQFKVWKFKTKLTKLIRKQYFSHLVWTFLHNRCVVAVVTNIRDVWNMIITSSRGLQIST